MMTALEEVIASPDNPLWELFRSCDGQSLQQTAGRIRQQLTETNVRRVFKSQEM
jgi:hypothetical protein